MYKVRTSKNMSPMNLVFFRDAPITLPKGNALNKEKFKTKLKNNLKKV